MSSNLHIRAILPRYGLVAPSVSIYDLYQKVQLKSYLYQL